MSKKLILLQALLLVFFSLSSAAQDPGPKQGKENAPKLTKWERKAQKAEKRSSRYKKQSVEALEGKRPNMSKHQKLKTKADKFSTNAQKMRYKGRSIRHVKVQDKSTRKRMKKNLKAHRRYKQNKRRK